MSVPYTDAAIDCESLGQRWDAPVIAIGAVTFDRKTGKLGQTFYEEIDFTSACKNARVDGETVAWWMRQNAEARQLFQDTGRVKLALATALQQFTAWGRALPGRIQPWGNGATADITWLEHAYDTGAVGLKEPWHFRSIRDMRTVLDVAEYLIGYDPLRDPDLVDHTLTPHNGLDDAKWQARAIATCYMKMKACVVKPADDEDF
ncbi:hypothetical protein D3C87_687590 [compost metagenome]